MYDLNLGGGGGTATLERPSSGQQRAVIDGTSGTNGGGGVTNALEQTKSLPPDQLKQHASKIYDSVIPLVQHDPLFHIWNECKQRKASGDPEAKYIVRMVNSRTRPLTHFFGSAIENFYGGGTSVRGSA